MARRLLGELEYGYLPLPRLSALGIWGVENGLFRSSTCQKSGDILISLLFCRSDTGNHDSAVHDRSGSIESTSFHGLLFERPKWRQSLCNSATIRYGWYSRISIYHQFTICHACTSHRSWLGQSRTYSSLKEGSEIIRYDRPSAAHYRVLADQRTHCSDLKIKNSALAIEKPLTIARENVTDNG